MIYLKEISEKLLHSSKRNPWAFILGVNFFCLLILYFLILRPQWIYFRNLQSQVVVLNKQESEKKPLINYKNQFKKLQSNWQLKSKGGSKNSTIGYAVYEISNLGFSNKLQFKLFKALPEKNCLAHGLLKIPIQISVMGNYDSLLQFMAQLSNLPELLVPEDFTLKKEKGAGINSLELTMILQIYRYEK